MEISIQKLSENIRLLNINDDRIIMNSKIKNLVADFTNAVTNEDEFRYNILN